jgi:hydroxymethylbilane synthase
VPLPGAVSDGGCAVVVRVAPFVGIAGAHRAGSRALHLIQDRPAPVVGAGRLAIIAPTMSTSLKIATRESRLALWQAEHVRHLLTRQFGLNVELLGMTTRGDQILDRTLSKVGGKGLFVKELEVALEEDRAQLAVHSLKDVPMSLPEGFVLAAVLEREDPRDAFVSNHHADVMALPEGAVVGTSSLRRVVQLLALRPDLRIEPLRGNLDTRLRKLDDGGYDAIVLAAAGLKRLGLAGRIRAVFTPEQMLPAAGQGALGIEVRAERRALVEQLATLTDTPTWLAVHAERAVSRTLGGSCSMPLAAHAVWQDGRLQLSAALGDASRPAEPLLRAYADGQPADAAAADALGVAVARALLSQGGDAYLARLPQPDPA